jgi:hypothetical protein
VRAYCYDVDVVISNQNTTESRVETRRIHAYNAIDALTQAVVEVSATAGSADLKVTRIAPPPEACEPIAIGLDCRGVTRV